MSPSIHKTGSRPAAMAMLFVVALLGGTAAQAADSCSQAALRGIPAEQPENGSVPLPDFAGCWHPDPAEGEAPAQFTGVNDELLGNMAVLLQPSSVTIANQNGDLRHVEIVKNGTSETVQANAPGSVAYWESQTLVVKTLVRDRGEGRYVHIVERIMLHGLNTLEFAILVTRPEEPGHPLKINIFYHRDDESVMFPQARPDRLLLIAYND